ncbi:hypothetical protein K1719_027628 [Acacia pycnantha]|nr:hypothetical protein K1719_027628 [Acacia pycnantha]
MDRLAALEIGLKTWANWVDVNIDRSRTKVFFQAISPTHYKYLQNLPFIENMEKRIQNASLIMDASLGHCFVDGLEHLDATAIAYEHMLPLITPRIHYHGFGNWEKIQLDERLGLMKKIAPVELHHQGALV